MGCTRASLSLTSPELSDFWCLGNQRFPRSPQELRSCEMRTRRKASHQRHHRLASALIGRFTLQRGISWTVRGQLAVDSVFATARAEIKTVSRPRPQKPRISGVRTRREASCQRRPTQNKLTRSPSRGTSNGFVAEPAPSVANLRFPTFRTDGNRRLCGSGSPAL